jgi:hypothetical protein
MVYVVVGWGESSYSIFFPTQLVPAHPKRFQYTQKGDYTLGGQSKKVISTLVSK